MGSQSLLAGAARCITPFLQQSPRQTTSHWWGCPLASCFAVHESQIGLADVNLLVRTARDHPPSLAAVVRMTAAWPRATAPQAACEYARRDNSQRLGSIRFVLQGTVQPAPMSSRCGRRRGGGEGAAGAGPRTSPECALHYQLDNLRMRRDSGHGRSLICSPLESRLSPRVSSKIGRGRQGASICFQFSACTAALQAEFPFQPQLRQTPIAKNRLRMHASTSAVSSALMPPK